MHVSPNNYNGPVDGRHRSSRSCEVQFVRGDKTTRVGVPVWCLRSHSRRNWTRLLHLELAVARVAVRSRAERVALAPLARVTPPGLLAGSTEALHTVLPAQLAYRAALAALL